MIRFSRPCGEPNGSAIAHFQKKNMKLRSIVLFTSVVLASPAFAGVVVTVDKARVLINQGNAFEAQGKVNEALASYRDAAKADPGASQPLSYLALLMFYASQNTEAQHVNDYRRQTEEYARAALKIDHRDPNAMEVLRLLADGEAQKRREPTAAAAALVREGEVLFGERKYAEAAVKYAEAARLDPSYADAVVFLGDCYYLQGDMVRAEQKFREATVIDPQFGAAWRYLYDALVKQDKRSEAAAAALGAVASLPSAQPNWLRVSEAMDLAGRPLRQFKWKPKASANGDEIQIDPTGAEGDNLAWMAYAISMAAADKGGKKLSPFARELAVWKDTLQIISEVGGTDKIKDQGLRDMILFNKSGQLQPAIFALMYKEAYRPDFEAWKRAEPEGLKRFIDTFGVGL